MVNINIATGGDGSGGAFQAICRREHESRPGAPLILLHDFIDSKLQKHLPAKLIARGI